MCDTHAPTAVGDDIITAGPGTPLFLACPYRLQVWQEGVVMIGITVEQRALLNLLLFHSEILPHHGSSFRCAGAREGAWA